MEIADPVEVAGQDHANYRSSARSMSDGARRPGRATEGGSDEGADVADNRRLQPVDERLSCRPALFRNMTFLYLIRTRGRRASPATGSSRGPRRRRGARCYWQHPINFQRRWAADCSTCGTAAT